MLMGLAGLALVPGTARASWTVNAGYHNPAVSTYGLNLLNIGTNWGFEIGVGWIDVAVQDDDSKSLARVPVPVAAEGRVSPSLVRQDETRFALAGGASLKYFFSSGKVRPYLQGGADFGIGATTGKDKDGKDDGGAGASAFGPYGGLGLLIGSPSFYIYGAYNLAEHQNTFAQAGLGIGL